MPFPILRKTEIEVVEFGIPGPPGPPGPVGPPGPAGASSSAWVYDGVLSASVSGNALTVSANGGKVQFRDVNLTSGVTYTRNVASPSITLSAGSTLGFTNNEHGRIYIYAIDNAGVVELGLCRVGNLNETIQHTTTPEGGAGGADNKRTLYTNISYPNVVIKLIGFLEITTGTPAGSWSNAPTKISHYGPGVHRTGDVVQYVETVISTPITINSGPTSWVDVPGFLIDIYLEYSTSIVKVGGRVNVHPNAYTTIGYYCHRDSTILWPTSTGTLLNGAGFYTFYRPDNYGSGDLVIDISDKSPAFGPHSYGLRMCTQGITVSINLRRDSEVGSVSIFHATEICA